MKYAVFLVNSLFFSGAAFAGHTVRATADYTGDNADVRIAMPGGAVVKMRISAVGTLSQMEIIVSGKRAGDRLCYYLSYWESRPMEMDASLYRGHGIYAEKKYFRQDNPGFFAFLDRFVKKLYKKYGLAKLAAEKCRERREFMGKRQESEKRERLERQKKMPEPALELEKLNKI